MTEHNLFMVLPDDLYVEAAEIARMQGVSLTHLMVEALSETVESYQRRGWIAERALLHAERGLGIRGVRQHRTEPN